MTPLIALLALLQADTAEENFKKIEDTIDKAKTICVRLKWEASTRGDPDGKVQATGVLLFKEGNKAFLRSMIQEHGQSSELLIVSDGTLVRSKLGPERLLECATPKNFNSGLRTA